MKREQRVRDTHVAIYIRWSTEDQGEGTTLDVQCEACEAYVRSQGWQVNPDLVFIDEGVSGGGLDRPALNALRAQVRDGQVDCVVVYKLDRLSRSVVDTVKLVLDEWEDRCSIKSAREPIDTLTQTGKLFFYQLVSFAEWERSVIRERTFAGKLRRAREGKNPGITAAYGYRLAPDGSLVIEPGEAAVVQLIYRLYRSGLGCTQLSRRLAELGHPSPTGRRWSEGQLSRLLSNPIYKGTLVYGKQMTVKGRRRKSETPHLVREGAAPVIIDTDLFAAVQAEKERRPGVGRGRIGGRSLSSRSLLTGLLRCPCGHAYCGNGGSGARSTYRYYYCGGAQSKGPSFCPSGRIRQEHLDDAVVAAFRERHLERERLHSLVMLELGSALRAAGAAAENATREARRLEEQEARLKELLLMGQVTVPEYRELMAVLKQRQTALGEASRAGPVNLTPLPDTLERLDPWQTLTPTEQKQVLRHFIPGIEARRSKPTGQLDLMITWATTA